MIVSISHRREWWGRFLFLCGVAAVVAASGPATAQATSVGLVRQDFSDCTNTTVDPKAPIQGTVWVVRGTDGNTSVKIGMTAQPDTTYHFFLKCVRMLGDIPTDDEGVGRAVFTFPTGSVGAVFAFDMYPEGAPAGNKFQSVQVRLE
jgi:hypothetical protein